MPSAILAIPFYFALAIIPHSYSVLLLGSTDSKLYDNANPHSAANLENLRKALGPAVFAKWERARSAYRNGLESFPVFAAAILAGVQTGLEGMWITAGLGIGLRAVYNVLYINTTSRKNSR